MQYVPPGHSSIRKSQLLSCPSQISLAPGWTEASWSLQSSPPQAASWWPSPSASGQVSLGTQEVHPSSPASQLASPQSWSEAQVFTQGILQWPPSQTSPCRQS